MQFAHRSLRAFGSSRGMTLHYGTSGEDSDALHATSSTDSALGPGSADNYGATLDHRTFSHRCGGCANARWLHGYPTFGASPRTLLWLQISCARPKLVQARYPQISAWFLPVLETCLNSRALE
jgi:hypothetical protein